jgi:hypothetical protein
MMDARKVTLTDAQGDILHGLWRIGEDAYAIIHANGHDLFQSAWERNGWAVSFDPE